MLSAMIASMGFVRALAIMVSRPDDENAFRQITNEPPLVALLLGGIGVLSLTVAVAPQTFTPIITYLMESFVF